MLVAERYRLVEQLGRGAMGEVWRAEDTALGRDVAVKLVLEQAAVDHAAERFRHEARTAARLNHPNVVAVYDFDEEDGRGYLVMEYVRGHSLRHELATRDVLDPGEAARIAGQAAAGLAAAHSHGVVHRDVKPGNLLLAADGTVKVADFGIARVAVEAASSLTSTGAVLGTGVYLAPERATGGDAGAASDVYALGCVLYEMLCGRPPFTGDPAAVVYQHVDRPPRPPAEARPEVPAALADFVLRMLAKAPDARPTAAQAARYLAGSAGEERVPAGRSALAGKAPAGDSRSTRVLAVPRTAGRSRRPAVLASAAMVVVFLVAAVVGFQLNSGQGDKADPPPATKPSTSEPARSPSPETGSTAGATASPSAGKDARKAAERERKRQAEADREAEEDARKAAEEERRQQEEADEEDEKGEKPGKGDKGDKAGETGKKG